MKIEVENGFLLLSNRSSRTLHDYIPVSARVKTAQLRNN